MDYDPANPASTDARWDVRTRVGVDQSLLKENDSTPFILAYLLVSTGVDACVEDRDVGMDAPAQPRPRLSSKNS
jgi:hypothetical protein